MATWRSSKVPLTRLMMSRSDSLQIQEGTDLIDLRLTWRIRFLETFSMIFGEFLRNFGEIDSLLED